MISVIDVYKWLKDEYRFYHRKVFYIKDIENKFGVTYSIAQHNVKALVGAEFAEEIPCGGAQKRYALTNKFSDNVQLPLLCLRTFSANKTAQEISKIIGEPETFVGMALRNLVFDDLADWKYTKDKSGTKVYFATYTTTFSPLC